MEISIVIPTYNRKESLVRLLHSLSIENELILEILIVNGGDSLGEIVQDCPTSLRKKIVILNAPPSVCHQRNIGIKKAIGEYIMLCDDDIEVANNYLSILLQSLKTYSNLVAISGLVKEKNKDGHWVQDHPAQSLSSWVKQFIFQAPVWADLNKINRDHILGQWLYNYYKKKGNHLSLGGWPILVNFSDELNYTPVFALGISLFRKSYIINHLFEETLTQHGIGDNYGVCLQLPAKGLAITNLTYALHHKEPSNRISNAEAYYNRVMALDYFQKKYGQQNLLSIVALLWSLIGNAIHFILHRKPQEFAANNRLIWSILTKKNKVS